MGFDFCVDQDTPHIIPSLFSESKENEKITKEYEMLRCLKAGQIKEQNISC